MSQKVLTMMTRDADPRSEADGWSANDSSLVIYGKPIGLTPELKEFYCFDCPLRAMSYDWKLLAPPIPVPDFVNGETWFQWWFIKD